MTDLIIPQVSPFDAIKQTGPQGEYWSARDLQELLEYTEWRKFSDAIDRARAACENSGQDSADHFGPAAKMIEAGKGAQREVLDYHLTRYACYLIAMNGDPRKAAIADAQTYFTVQTRRMEVLEQQPHAMADFSELERLAGITAQAITNVKAELRAEIDERFDRMPIQGEEIDAIHRRVVELGRLMGGAGVDRARAWRLFKDRFHLASYRDLPKGRLAEALAFLDAQLDAYAPPATLKFEAAK